METHAPVQDEVNGCHRMPVDRVGTECSKRIEPHTVLVGRQGREGLLRLEVGRFLIEDRFIARRSDVLGDGPGEPQKIIGCVRARHEAGPTEMAPRPVGVWGQTPEATTPTGVMPDLRGLSARDAIRSLMPLGLTPRIDGDGFVVEQSPRAGAELARGESCVLKLGRRPPTSAGGTVQ